MGLRKLPVLLILCCIACKNNGKEQEKFDKKGWAAREDNEYTYRNKMLPDLMENYKLHGLKVDSIVNLLGEPNRSDNGHLFYTVAQKFFPNTSWPISTKTLVIKLANDSTVEWRKIHE